MALVPDMELLESSASDARTAHSAMAAAAGSGRKQGPAPKLTDRNATTTVRIAAPQVSINDDPYADLMPEPDAPEASIAPTLAATPRQAAPPPRPAPPPPQALQPAK
ncbi:MAG: hypothetical protein WA825_02080, partial [Steroidobacteraceae bacterium]